MSAENDILELKFEGNGINPSKVKPSEIASIIQDFEKAILCTIKTTHPAIDTNEVLFTLEEIKDASIGINFVPNTFRIPPEIKSLVISSYVLLSTSIASGNYSQLSNDTLYSLKRISKFAKKYECSASFRHNGESLSTITPSTDIKLNQVGLIKGDTTIFGELIDSGGDNPNIHLKINDDYTVIIDTDKKKAKELATKLYDYIGLKGQAKWDVLTSRIVEFKLYEVLEYSGGNISGAFSELRGNVSGYWDNFNSNDDINKQLLRD